MQFPKKRGLAQALGTGLRAEQARWGWDEPDSAAGGMRAVSYAQGDTPGDSGRACTPAADMPLTSDAAAV